jgi:hypothetical protein
MEKKNLQSLFPGAVTSFLRLDSVERSETEQGFFLQQETEQVDFRLTDHHQQQYIWESKWGFE